MKLKDACSLEVKLWQPGQLKNKDITLLTTVCIIKAMVFPGVMYGCECWTIKNADHWRIGAFESRCWRSLLSPLDCKVIKPVNSKENQPWIFIGRTGAEAEAPILWPSDEKSQHIGKDPDAGKDWGQEKKRTTEDEMAGWHHRLDGHRFEQPTGDMEDRGAQCAAVQGVTESDKTYWHTTSAIHLHSIIWMNFTTLIILVLLPA